MKTRKQLIKEAAARIDLTPEISGIMQRFFLETSTRAERNRLDRWLHEQEGNFEFFDLMVDFTCEGTGGAAISALIRNTKKSPRKRSPFWKWFWRIFLGGLALIIFILWLDHIMPSHPLTRLVKGHPVKAENFGDSTTRANNVPVTLWLPDSSHVVLHPGASLTYSHGWYGGVRRIYLNGAARISVKKTDSFGIFTYYGDYAFRVYSGAFEVIPVSSDSLHPMVKSHGGNVEILEGRKTLGLVKNGEEANWGPVGYEIKTVLH
ncbi:hypothetical protein [Flavihumibacter petaseus]|uniref:FecR protein domain-containing protein n=1 Tax=Flavihumibacter petaseus NBRC 106054 TaxID=1220578 RepID=A0A0E9MXT7_9BACT|nr:hypothetical protein [Flavihumibacter petaseus]GAO42328.1 hypothetical protein FPE01S_01_13420 [Flavihumibacter petaseus NBRC 106054]